MKDTDAITDALRDVYETPMTPKELWRLFTDKGTDEDTSDGVAEYIDSLPRRFRESRLDVDGLWSQMLWLLPPGVPTFPLPPKTAPGWFRELARVCQLYPTMAMSTALWGLQENV